MLHRVLLALFTIPLLFGAINSNGDFQIWDTQTMRGNITDDLTMHGQVEMRFGDDASKMFYFYGEMGLGHKFGTWGFIEGTYRQEGRRIGQTNTWRANYIPMLDFHLYQSKHGLKVANRVRVMFVMRDPGFKPNRFVFRERLTITMPGWIFGAHPFLFEEIFFVQREGFSQSRTAIGLKTDLPHNINLDFYYLRRYRKRQTKEWVHQNIFGITTVFRF